MYLVIVSCISYLFLSKVLDSLQDPETLAPMYIGVVDLDHGKATLVMDDGPDGIWIYEGDLVDIDVSINDSLHTWIGRCTNGDGIIKAAFCLTKCDE